MTSDAHILQMFAKAGRSNTLGVKGADSCVLLKIKLRYVFQIVSES